MIKKPKIDDKATTEIKRSSYDEEDKRAEAQIAHAATERINYAVGQLKTENLYLMARIEEVTRQRDRARAQITEKTAKNAK
jgi:hypothetical protein